jgi:hypothetical protein
MQAFWGKIEKVYLSVIQFLNRFVLITLVCCFNSWGDNRVDVDTVYNDRNATSDSSEYCNSDSAQVTEKQIVDSIPKVIDTVEIKVNHDSLSSVPPIDTSAFCNSLSPEKKQVKSRHEPENNQYRGMSRDADHIAQQIVLDAYRGNWEDVSRGLEHLERVERRHALVKISRLLNVSVRTYRLEQNEFLTDVERMIVERELDSCIRTGLSYIETCRNEYLPLHELIYCGIKGFQVSRIIEKNPVEAAIQGYAVIGRLEKLLQMDSTMYDACMGLGLFYCSVASASPVIRAALTLTGKHVTMEKGLSYLRTGAQKGHYVNIPSLVYLTQFLSPYMGDQTAEKDSIFILLQKKCENNPRYLFEQIDENICFHPQKFTVGYNGVLRKKIAGYKSAQPYLLHYYELMKYQYCKYIDTTNYVLKPDTSINLRSFNFYPAFLDGLRYKEMCMVHTLGSFNRLHVKDCEKNTAVIIRKLDAASMVSTKREFYRWHIIDALKLR